VALRRINIKKNQIKNRNNITIRLKEKTTLFNKGKRMGIQDKIKNAKKSNWLGEGLSTSEMKSIVELAQISAKIERKRIELGMTQKEFAKFMGVTQGMVSKWESREYNFTIRSLNDICERLNLEFHPNINNKIIRENYSVISINPHKNNVPSKKSMEKVIKEGLKMEGAIA
jgi:transcriptional regulator with XRE-family HTH domain